MRRFLGAFELGAGMVLRMLRRRPPGLKTVVAGASRAQSREHKQRVDLV